MNLTLKNLAIENLFSYGTDSNFINFESTSLSLILGQTNGNLALSNGTGKSALFNSILWALYGRLLSGKAYDTIVKPGQSKGQVTLTLGLDQKTLVIMRSRDVQQQKTTLDLYLDNACLTAETIAETEKKLASLIGLSFLMFRNSLYFGQEDLEHFGSQSNLAKKNLFSSIIKLQVIDLALDKAKILFTESSSINDKLLLEKDWVSKEKDGYLSLKALKLKLLLLSKNESLSLKTRERFSLSLSQQNDSLLVNTRELSDLSIKSKEYYDLLAKNQNIELKRDTKITFFNKEKTDLELRIQGLEKDILAFTSAVDLNFTVDGLDLASFESKLKKLNFLDQNYVKKAGKIDLQLAKIDVEKSFLDQRLESLEELGDICPLCETPIPLIKSDSLAKDCLDKISLLLQRRFELSIELKKIYLDKEDNKVKLFKIEEDKSVLLSSLVKREKLNKLLSEKDSLAYKLTTYLAVFKGSMLELSEELQSVQEKLSGFTHDFDEQRTLLNSQRREFQESIISFEQKILVIDQELKSMAVEKDGIEKSIAKITSYNERLKQIQEDLSKIAAELKKFDTLKKAFGPKGIKTFVIEDILSTFELCVNNYIKLLFTHDVLISFSTQAAKKNSDESLDRFDIAVSVKGVTKPYSCFSPGEKRRFDLAIKLALADLIKQNFAVIPQFLFFDEAMDSLDEDGRNRFLNLVNSLSEKVKTILVVSHDSTFQEYFRSIILVNKSDNTSKIMSS